MISPPAGAHFSFIHDTARIAGPFLVQSGYSPLNICTLRKQQTVTSATNLPQQQCCSHEWPQLLFNANYFGFHSHHLDGVIWLTWHLWKWSIWREEWDYLFEERNTMAYSDSHEIEYGQRCYQMYITLWQRVGKLEGYRSTRNTSLWHTSKTQNMTSVPKYDLFLTRMYDLFHCTNLNK
jgi:hypothetical protein